MAAGLLVGFLAGKYGSRGGSDYSSGFSGDGDCVEIYVGNLSYDMTEAQMRKEFEKFGTVKSARTIANRFNHKSKGFGFVEMPNRPEAEAAIRALHDKEILGRKLRVNEAKNKSRE
jgi:RNA recognition motif-containing protein